ncbi:MAG: hypothetical protein V4726_14520 [Verrucomicrobiota bacterium]
MASTPSQKSSLLLPQLNPFISCLLDAFIFLNEALEKAAADPGRAFALARASTMHTLAALHAAANSALRFEDHPVMPSATLAEKFATYLIILHETGLRNEDIVVLQELEIVGSIVNNPQVAQAKHFPHPEKTNLIEFDRTPFKKISHQASHWIPAYAGCALGLAASFLSRFFRGDCGLDVERLEILFGFHANSADAYTTAFDEGELAALGVERRKLLENQPFIRRMTSERWLMREEDFRLTLFDGCPGYV